MAHIIPVDSFDLVVFGGTGDLALRKLLPSLYYRDCDEQLPPTPRETVQNLMALRFANALFEPLWSHGSIDHVQITVAETVGVGDRGGYYDDSRRAARHGAEPPAAAAVPYRDGAARQLRRRGGARREAEGAARAAPDRRRGHRCRNRARPVQGRRRRRRGGARLWTRSWATPTATPRPSSR